MRKTKGSESRGTSREDEDIGHVMRLSGSKEFVHFARKRLHLVGKVSKDWSGLKRGSEQWMRGWKLGTTLFVEV